MTVYESLLEDKATDLENDQPDNDESNIIPDDAISITNWDSPIYDSIKEAPFDASAPIPYVSDLSLDGLLTIGWDAKMIQPSAEVLRKRVAIKDWKKKSNFDGRKLSGSETVLITDTTTRITMKYKLFYALDIILIDESD